MNSIIDIDNGLIRDIKWWWIVNEWIEWTWSANNDPQIWYSDIGTDEWTTNSYHQLMIVKYCG